MFMNRVYKHEHIYSSTTAKGKGVQSSQQDQACLLSLDAWDVRVFYNQGCGCLLWERTGMCLFSNKG